MLSEFSACVGADVGVYGSGESRDFVLQLCEVVFMLYIVRFGLFCMVPTTRKP